MGLAVFVVLGFIVVMTAVSTRVIVPDRSQAVVERQLVVSNLGQRERSRPFRLLSRFSPLFHATSIDTKAVNVENILLLEDYPFLPICVHGPWISPGDIVEILVLKDQDGNVLDLRLNQ